MKIKQTIRAFDTAIMGYIEEDTITGNKIAYNRFNSRLGEYDKKSNVTRLRNGRYYSMGDMTNALIQMDYTDPTKPYNKNK